MAMRKSPDHLLDAQALSQVGVLQDVFAVVEVDEPVANRLPEYQPDR